MSGWGVTAVTPFSGSAPAGPPTPKLNGANPLSRNFSGLLGPAYTPGGGHGEEGWSCLLRHVRLFLEQSLVSWSPRDGTPRGAVLGKLHFASPTIPRVAHERVTHSQDFSVMTLFCALSKSEIISLNNTKKK